MNLMELKSAVDSAIELAVEYGEQPENIIVSLQLDGVETGCVFSSNEVRLHYDNNVYASGCVLTAFMEMPSAKVTAAVDTKQGTDNV